MSLIDIYREYREEHCSRKAKVAGWILSRGRISCVPSLIYLV